MKRGISNWVVLALVFIFAFSILSFVKNTSAADASDVEDFVTRFYELCLGRSPDTAGLDSWVSALLDGSQTGSDVAYGFVFSQEFLSKNTTDEEYLQVLYEAFFNRQPDLAGKQGWLDAMQKGASREDVLNGFIYAQEFNNLCWEYGILPNPVTAFVARFYQLCLGRNPERAGLDDWTNELQSRTKAGADVAYGFVFSQEFLGKNTSNEDYLAILYDAFFDRQPDPAGWDTWLAELDGGKVRLFVLNGFIYSTEFSELCKRFGISAFSDPDVDSDGDGFSRNQGDCNDRDSNIYPRAAETCGDGTDQDCDGYDLLCPEDIDNDGDGYTENDGDCNDADSDVHPNATEVCTDGRDNDCDGNVDDDDTDCQPVYCCSCSCLYCTATVTSSSDMGPSCFDECFRACNDNPYCGPYLSGRPCD